MAEISSNARQIIMLIGNARDKTTWGEVSFPQLSRLLQIHTIKSDLRNTLECLKSHDLISEKTSQSGETSLTLTNQGFRLYYAIKYEGGLTMQHDQIGIETSLNLDLEKDLSFVENFFVTWNGNFVHVLGDALSDRALVDDSIFLCYLALLRHLLTGLHTVCFTVHTTLFCANCEVYWKGCLQRITSIPKTMEKASMRN